MKCIEIKEPGGPEVLISADRPQPTPGPGEILIKVRAAGVNRPDALQRRGMYPPPDGASDLPGLEVAGTVAQAPDDSPWKIGDRVMALLPGGGYAEYAAVDARHALAVPDALTDVEAAALPETLFTVWANVFEDARLTGGETLFVHGATSGIGTMAATLAGLVGAKTYGTAGTDEKCRAAEGIGFTQCFNYKTSDWAAEMSTLGGADVILDMVGGDYVEKNLSFLKPGGRHSSIAFLGGIKGTVNILSVMQKRLTLTGSTLRARSADEKARLANAIMNAFGKDLATGALKPVIDQTFALDEAAKAHQRLEAGDHLGKIVLAL